MSDLSQHIANLSLEEKRQLLGQLMRKQAGKARTFPLSLGQQRLWFLDQLASDGSFHNLPFSLGIRGPLKQIVLKRCLAEIVSRHYSLRTTFTIQGEQPVQIISKVLLPDLSIIDLRTLSEANKEKEKEVARLVTLQAERSFDLDRGPLMRFSLLHLNNDEYVLLAHVHRIILDKGSVDIFIRELIALYEAFSGGRSSPLPALPIQYVDFALRQRQQFQGEVFQQHLAYWKSHLAGVSPMLALPTDRPRPAIQTFQAASERFLLPKSLSEQLKRFSQKEGATLFVTLLAVFQVLLFRYSQQHDIVVGTPVSLREDDTMTLIGNFANMLILRTELSGNLTFRALLDRVRQVVSGAYAHQALPYEMLLEELQIERDLSRHALFQVTFTLQSPSQTEFHSANLNISMMDIGCEPMMFDLDLSIQEEPYGLGGELRYNFYLFHTSTIVRMLGHFQVLLAGIIANPDQLLVDLPLLTAAERQQLIIEWNANTTAYPHDRCLHQFFEAHAERIPDSIALALEDEQITYQEVNRRANQLAQYLQKLGVGPEVLVGLSMERTPEMILGILGILKAGGAYVPLDPAYPKERVAFMLSDAQAAVVLTQQHLTAIFAQSTAPLICLDRDWQVIAQESAQNSVRGSQADNTAYVIYTSGSTGRPKGVCVRHTGVVNVLLDFEQRQPIFAGDRGSLWTSLNFDASVYEIFSTLIAGGALYLTPEHTYRDSELFFTWLETYQIHSAYIPPFMLANFAARLRRGAFLLSLRRLMVGVEPIPEALLGEINAPLPALQIINAYGPTEASICATLYNVSRHSPQQRNAPIGRPIQNTCIYLLDQQLRPVPMIMPGELYIGGDGLAIGYLNRPELTAERFIPDPFGPPGSRLYKTGDLARYLSDGNIEFVGRADYQVKLRGFRIELGEIEEVLRGHAQVQECVVIVREDTPGNKRLVAYVVLAQGEHLTTGELRHYLQERLPDYMVPSAMLLLEALPLTPNRKVDRRALPAPQQTSDDLFVAPQNPLEEVVADIWTYVLKVERVGAHDNFFELGGQSLLVTQAISRIRSIFNVEVPLLAFFENPFVSDLARYIENLQQAEQGIQAPPLTAVARPEAIPLSFSQQRLWFIEQLIPDQYHYNVPLNIRLQGMLEVSALERSLNEIVRRHEILRTTFATVQGQPVQVISPSLSVSLPIIDLQSLSEVDQEAAVLRIISEEIHCPFDLVRGPLLRMLLLRLRRQEHILLLNQHHIIADGWSAGIFEHELVSLYESFSQGKASPLPDLPLQYADYAIWQRQWLQGELFQAHVAYWRRQLADVPSILELPTDFPRPAVQTFEGTFIPFSLSKSLSEDINAFSQQEEVTLFMTLLAAFQVLLFRYSGQRHIAVGSPIANRTRPEVEGLIGFFVNTVVLCIDLSGDPTCRDLLGRVRKIALEAYDHQDLPFERLVEELQPERDLSFNPLFQVMLVLQNAPKPSRQVTSIAVRSFLVPTNASSFDITLHLTDTEQGIRGGFEYNTNLFKPATIERMGEHLRTLLMGMVSQPELHLSALPMLSEAERDQQLVEWNNTQVAYPRTSYLHQLVEAQVERTPDSTALVFEDQQLSYQELNRRANKLAHYLQHIGIQGNDLVGICVERSLEMVIGILAVLKAGTGYVPLDPSSPKDRLAFILQDTQVPVLLTQRWLLEQLPQLPIRYIFLDALDKEEICQFGVENPTNSVTNDHPAYVVYTSGSTGKPKGVVITQGNICQLLHWGHDRIRWLPSDHVLQYLSYFFDWSVWEIFMALTSGASLYLMTFDVLLDSRKSVEFIERNHITVWHVTPTQFRFVGRENPRLETLRWVCLGAEKFDYELLELCSGVLSRECRIFNAYGPTEATITTTILQVDPAISPHEGGTSVPIGRPIANMYCYVLGQNYALLPVGVAGELYIAGEGVASGYVRRPDLTAEKFVPNPFIPGTRMYKTGDRVRWLPDGTIEFLGRFDFQVKLRGFRIELEEIETVLMQHADVREAIVLAQKDAANDTRLVAYVVSTLSVDELYDYMKQMLPNYMIPASFVILEAFPLSPNGKVDRKALQTFEATGTAFTRELVAPRTLTEEKIVAIWKEVLEIESISIYDNFFTLGGHSLLATQLIFHINEALQVQLPLRSLFEELTPAGLGNAVERIKKDAERGQEQVIVRISREAHRVKLSSLDLEKQSF